MLFAQTEATVSGTVADPSGARIVDGTITAVNLDTGAVASAKTNEAGIYEFAALPPGRYRFTAEHTGFRKAQINDMVLAVGAKLTVNLSLELGQTTETVEVQAVATEINASTATIGTVVEQRRILDLPLVGRNAYDLLGTQPGITLNGANGVNMNGAQTGAVNYTTDGINTQDNLLNGAFNTNVANTVSVDRVEEFRVVTSPADAEYGRGSGQVQLITRGGTNRFAGSAWEELRNTDLNANDWFNNQAGTNPITGQPNAPRNVLVRNQYGLRFGGPVKKNKTFFNGYWDNDHQNQRVATNTTVYTPTAIQGLYRFFPGALNGNATALIPTVNASGVPTAPATATGPLQTVSVLGRDPNRLAENPLMAATLGLMPAPNNYLVGDGLNTAGFLWARPVIDDFEIYEGRIDHLFDENNRLSLVLNHQAYTSTNVANAQALPSSPIGLAPTETTQYSLSYTRIIRPNLINEARMGVFRPRTIIFAQYDPGAGPSGAAGLKELPTAGGVPYLLTLTANIPAASYPINQGTSSNRMTQNWEYGDNLTWIRGKHSFKGGFTIRYLANTGYDTVGVVPVATIAAGAVGVQNISTGSPIAGIGTNATGAQNLLLDLTGSISNITQTVNATPGKNPQFLPGLTRYSDLLSREYSGFFKDDWKVTPRLTLNLGVRYEWYGVPFDGHGGAVAVTGGGAGLFGISGTSLASEFQPGLAGGSLTTFQAVGPDTNNAGAQLYKSDNNNWAPFVGFAWAVPWWGENKTVIRAGYGIAYQRDSLYVAHMNSSYNPGALSANPIEQSTALLTVNNITLPIANNTTPFTTVPLNGARNQAAYGFNQSLVNPYVQNWNLTIQHQFANHLSMSIAYVGSAGDRLVRSYDLNEIDILNNGFLQAYNIVRAGGDSPLIDALVKPLGLNSTTIRNSAIFQPYLAGNQSSGGIAGLAALLNGSALTGGVGGALISAAGLPANFFVVNPQFAPFPFGSSTSAFGGDYITDNTGHSSYHSLQVQAIGSLANGLSLQGSYVFSKALGSDSAGDSATFYQAYRTLRNFALDKEPLAFNHAHVFKINGIYELPFGANKPWVSHGFFSHIVGGWQTGGIFTYFTGAPVTVTGADGLNTSFANGTFLSTATQVGPVSTGAQKVGSGVVYFPGTTQITDPQVSQLLSSLAAVSTLKAIASSNGLPIFVNAQPGQLGALGIGTLTAPSTWRLDMNLIKRIRIGERFNLQIGATAENLPNNEAFAPPTATNLNINSATFGKITATATGFTPRIIVIQTRLNF